MNSSWRRLGLKARIGWESTGFATWLTGLILMAAVCSLVTTFAVRRAINREASRLLSGLPAGSAMVIWKAPEGTASSRPGWGPGTIAAVRAAASHQALVAVYKFTRDQPVRTVSDGRRYTAAYIYVVDPLMLDVQRRGVVPAEGAEVFKSRSHGRVCLLGKTVAEGLFGGRPAAGRKVTLAGRVWTVAGVLEPFGGSQLGQDLDNVIWIPLDPGLRFLGLEPRFRAILIRAVKPSRLSAVLATVRTVLRKAGSVPAGHGDGFRVLRYREIRRRVLKSSRLLRATLWGLTAALMIGVLFSVFLVQLSHSEKERQTLRLKRALGARRSVLVFEIIAKQGALSAAGAVLGIVAADVLLTSVQPPFLSRYGAQFSWGGALAGLAFASALAVAGFLSEARHLVPRAETATRQGSSDSLVLG